MFGLNLIANNKAASFLKMQINKSGSYNNEFKPSLETSLLISLKNVLSVGSIHYL